MGRSSHVHGTRLGRRLVPRKRCASRGCGSVSGPAPGRCEVPQQAHRASLPRRNNLVKLSGDLTRESEKQLQGRYVTYSLTVVEALLDNTEPLGQRRRTQMEYTGAMSWMRRVVAVVRNLPRRVNTP